MRLPSDMPTPSLVVDQRRLERNLRAMAASAADRGIRLRPHAKTHKTAQIGRRQLDLGAVGLTVATIGEAEAFADAGVHDLFVAYPLWPSPGRLTRLRSLAERVRLRLGVESPAAAGRLGQLARGMRPPEILVEVDSGHHRTGVPPEESGGVGLAAARAGLAVVGVFTFPGHSYAPGAGEKAAAEEASALAAAEASLRTAGVIPAGPGRPGGPGEPGAAERSGGSTPTALRHAEPPLTELRPGVYVFGDAQQVELGVCGMEEVALAAAATVVSRQGTGRMVLDCGSKVLGADRQPWATGFGRLPGCPDARVVALSEHHATVTLPAGTAVPDLGEVLTVIPNHVCAAVNLADELLVVRDGKVIDSWRLIARGANS